VYIEELADEKWRVSQNMLRLGRYHGLLHCAKRIQRKTKTSCGLALPI